MNPSLKQNNQKVLQAKKLRRNHNKQPRKIPITSYFGRGPKYQNPNHFGKRRLPSIKQTQMSFISPK